jgi:hypothetical protein
MGEWYTLSNRRTATVWDGIPIFVPDIPNHSMGIDSLISAYISKTYGVSCPHDKKKPMTLVVPLM